jgi:hypothetical protein
VYQFNKLVRSTLWRTVSAASKVKLANALASGSADRVVDVRGKMALRKWPSRHTTNSALS